MSRFEVEYVGNLPAYGTLIVDAENADQAEEQGLEAAKLAEDDLVDIKVEAVRELNG